MVRRQPYAPEKGFNEFLASDELNWLLAEEPGEAKTPCLSRPVDKFLVSDPATRDGRQRLALRSVAKVRK
jgi:hypothetical protein